jgi:hypothetical protein
MALARITLDSSRGVELARGSEHSPFGPVGVLPPIYCEATFRSVLHRSFLVVAWFQDDLSAPVTEFVTAAVTGLVCEELADP